MINNFNRTMDFIFKWEGYKSNHPDDPGGLTIWGISSRSWGEDVKKMEGMEKDASRKYALDFYKQQYWDKCGCSDLAFPLDMIVMDTAVNMGVGRALEFRGKARGGASFPDWVDFLMLRIGFYTNLAKKNPVFLRGWLNRVNDLYASAVKSEEHPLSNYKEV